MKSTSVRKTRMKKNFIPLIGVLFALTSLPAFSEGGSYFTNFVGQVWSTADGLPGNTVTDIIQDSIGYIYIGTYEGLVRFDGVEFVTFNRSYNPKYDFVSARKIFEDSKKNLWIGSNDECLEKICADGSIKIFTLEDGLPNVSIRALQEDLYGNIWVGTAKGVVYIDPNNNIHQISGLEEYGEENIIVTNLYCDSAGRIWLSSAKVKGLFVYNNSRFERYEGIKTVENPVVTCVTQDSDGAFWFGVSPHFAVRQKNGSEKLYNLGHGSQPGTLVNAMFEDSGKNMWFCADSGVSLLHNGEISFYTMDEGLADNNVNHVIEDREGNIWLATDRGGIEKLSLSRIATIPFPTTINAIAEDTVRKVSWLGGDKGLYCVDHSLNQVENEYTRYCANVRIRSVELCKNGDLLLSCYEKFGLLRLSSNGSKKSWRVEDGLPGNKVRCTLEASDGKIYVGTTNGLGIIFPNGSVKALTKDDGFPNEFIMCLYEDKDKNIWVGTDGGGVVILSPEQEIISRYDATSGLAGNVIFKIMNLRDNDLWITTGTGITLIRNGKMTNFNSARGLGSDGIFQMINDYTDTVWMTSNRGISSVRYSAFIDIAEGRSNKLAAKFLTRSDGLKTAGATSTSLSMKDSIGRVWFTLTDGIAVYDPAKVMANRQPPTVQVLNADIDNDETDIADGSVVLAPRAHRLRIKYTGLSFVSTEALLFSYYLDGFDHDWCPWASERTVSYTNLKPGKYTFRVKALNSDDVESLPSDPITIIKRPYFWQLWYFWLLVVVLVVAATASFLWVRYRSLKRYQKQLEHEVAVQTEELHIKNEALEKQAAELEKRSHDLEIEKEKSERLLLNILPESVAQELSENPDEIIARHFPSVAVLFADIVGFTKMSDKLSADVLVTLLNGLFSRFDVRAEEEKIEKIKTIGDAYMAACGLSDYPDPQCSAALVRFAMGMFKDLNEFNEKSGLNLQMRIGINTGNLVAGVIGKTKFIYDIWGDTVNVASRMESTGMPGKIHVTEDTRNLCLKEGFEFSDPVLIEVKGKGQMETYFV